MSSVCQCQVSQRLLSVIQPNVRARRIELENERFACLKQCNPCSLPPGDHLYSEIASRVPYLEAHLR